MVKNTVQLICATTPHWSVLVQTCVDIFGTSPTRELDIRGIRLADPTAYTSVLEILNGKTHEVEKANRSLDFVHLTFLIQFEDEEQFTNFCNLTDICKLIWMHKKGPVGVFCGTLKQLKELVIISCVRDIDQEIRLTANKIYCYLDQSGYRGLFKVKSPLADGTFILA
jgi:hypothetical protein